MARRLETADAPIGSPEAPAGLTDVEALPILIVDDRPENLRTLHEVLAPLGYPIQTAHSGREALRLLLEREFGLILLDVRMPGLDGLETARLIKGRERTRDIPIVFMTAARDDLGDVVRGYGVGAVDYVLKPVDPELLRSKVAVFAELERGRRALKHSEAFLRAAFEAAPIGKTMLDGERRIVRSNPAFARMVGREPSELQGVPVAELCHEEDREMLTAALESVARGDSAPTSPELAGVDLRLEAASGSQMWVGLVATSIQSAELDESLLLVQWVDLSARRRTEQARAELLVEHAARTHAEALAEHLGRLQGFSGAIESLSLDELLPQVANRLAELFDAQAAEVLLEHGLEQPIVVRAEQSFVHRASDGPAAATPQRWFDAPLRIEGATVGVLRLGLAPGRDLTEPERSLLYDVAERAALSIGRAQLHEQEHRIAVELQRGLLPKALPEIAGIELVAHYQAAGLGAEAGGDWYDAFALGDGRVGVVIGDVAGRGVAAASAMGQLRSVTRAFAVADGGERTPGEVLTRLNSHQLALGRDELFTVVYAIIDRDSGSVCWANAGHPPPLLRATDGNARYLEGGEGLTGLEEIIYADQRVPLGIGDLLVFYTDGLVERRGESLDAGLERLQQAVGAGPEDPEELCEHILQMALLPDARLQDDVTALVAKFV